MGFGLKTITRYENGAIQDNTHDNLLRLANIEENFWALWIMNKDNLTDSENMKISSRFSINKLPETNCEYREPGSCHYTTTLPINGVVTYDWSK